MNTSEFFGTEKISKILWKLAPPVMLAQLIQALYNRTGIFLADISHHGDNYKPGGWWILPADS